jgi:aminoglycoside phosphotransferase (APT) family kinase protein
MSNTAETVDPVEVLSVLGFADQSSIVPVTGGADATIWHVVCGSEHYALRVLRPDQTDQAQREASTMTLATSGGVPVPRVVTTGTWRDRPSLLLTWSLGDSLSKVLKEHPLAWRRSHKLGTEFGRAQAAIHTISLPFETYLHGYAWEEWAGPDPDLRTCLAKLQRRPAALLHLDYHPLNVLTENGKVSAVLDWANSTVGDPRADFARTLSILRLAPIPTGLAGAVARVQLRAFEAGWRHGYEEVAGPLDSLAPFCWWAGLVMERDLSPRLSRPDLPWLTPAFFDRVRAWTAAWRQESMAICSSTKGDDLQR